MKFNRSFNRLLMLTFIFICALIACRIGYTKSIQHLSLIWNIFLAWIPYALSNHFKLYLFKQKWKQYFLLCGWLLFFPNALYIITDLIHLQECGGAPVWFDAILLFTSSLFGLIMAYISLHNAEKFLLEKFNKRIVSFIMPLIIFTASFGVYLGRFQRWNSWDVFHSPFALGENIADCFIFPVDHFHTWIITFILSGLFYLIYRFSKILPGALE